VVKPIIEKIEFTKEEQADIDALLAGRPLKATMDKLTSIGWDAELWASKRKRSRQSTYDLLKKKYYHGICLLCSDWPDYKVLIDVGGAQRREWYCEKHLPKF
jgi:hypothetical protein